MASLLETLFGSTNVMRALLFLFVNGSTYARELATQFHTALTPMQKALLRLEKEGVIVSEYQGKTRIIQFNLAYPLLEELQALLKKTFLLLSREEKNAYYLSQKEAGMNLQSVAEATWKRLLSVKRVTFQAESLSSQEVTHWKGKGAGNVQLLLQNSTTIIFTEKGSWNNEQKEPLTFSNVFRWTYDKKGGKIRLEHLRHGHNAPVFLFDLVPVGKNKLSSLEPHSCGADSYFGEIHLNSHTLKLSWRVIGEKKNEKIDYLYFQ